MNQDREQLIGLLNLVTAWSIEYIESLTDEQLEKEWNKRCQEEDQCK